jgi:hypothetical protein
LRKPLAQGRAPDDLDVHRPGYRPFERPASHRGAGQGLADGAGQRFAGPGATSTVGGESPASIGTNSRSGLGGSELANA